jgi:hypothetical protein
MNRSGGKRPAEEGSPSNKRNRNLEAVVAAAVEVHRRSEREAVEISNSSTSSSSLSVSASSNRTQPLANALASNERGLPQGECGTNSLLLEQLLGRLPPQASSSTPSSNLNLGNSLFNNLAANLSVQQQQNIALQAALTREQQQNYQIADLLSNQMLLQRQRQMQLEQQQSRDVASYYKMLQDQARSNAASNQGAFGSVSGLLTGSLTGSNAGLLGASSMLGGDAALTGMTTNSLWNLVSSQAAAQRASQLQQPQNQLILQQLAQQQGLTPPLGATIGGGSLEMTRMVDALLLEQLANRSSTAGQLAVMNSLMQQQQNQAPSPNPLSSLMEAASARLNGPSDIYGAKLDGASLQRRGLQRSSSDSSLAMPSPYQPRLTLDHHPKPSLASDIVSKTKLADAISKDYKVVPMSIPADQTTLSEYQCLVREQIIFFAATPDDVSSSVQGRNRPIVLGQVGLHCVHCWHEQHAAGHRNSRLIRQKPRGASYYPSKLSGIYQAAQNMVTNHFMDSCRCLPIDVKAKLVAPRANAGGEMPTSPYHPTSAVKRGWASSNAGGGKQYWANAAQQLGIVETEEHGLIFKSSLVDNMARKDAAEGEVLQQAVAATVDERRSEGVTK